MGVRNNIGPSSVEWVYVIIVMLTYVIIVTLKVMIVNYSGKVMIVN